MFNLSDELKRVFLTAEELSPNKVTSFGLLVPLITPELFLAATIRTDGIELGSLLRESGIDLERLEQMATKQLSEPEKLMF